jgi:hypothetical protein
VRQTFAAKIRPEKPLLIPPCSGAKEHGVAGTFFLVDPLDGVSRTDLNSAAKAVFLDHHFHRLPRKDRRDRSEREDECRTKRHLSSQCMTENMMPSVIPYQLLLERLHVTIGTHAQRVAERDMVEAAGSMIAVDGDAERNRLASPGFLLVNVTV